MRRKPTEADKYGLSSFMTTEDERQCCNCNYYISNEAAWAFRSTSICADQRKAICTVCAPTVRDACKVAKKH